MYSTPTDEEPLDDGSTDELPMLREADESDDDRYAIEADEEHTDRHRLIESGGSPDAHAPGARAATLEEERARAAADNRELTRQLAERDGRLSALTAEVERRRSAEQALQGELGASRSAARAERARAAVLEAELAAVRDELASAAARALEDAAAHGREMASKDRQLDDYELRILVLQQELDKKLATLQQLNAMELSVAGLDQRIAERFGHSAEALTPPSAPALVCLTGDAPPRFALRKASVTIGRSSQCDIQILTHFVSREHARLVVDADRVVVEDLGSTNGVFVNSTRVERRQLQHADVLTIGETRFRFVATMAH